MSLPKEGTEQGTSWSSLQSQDLASRREGLKGQLPPLALCRGTACFAPMGSAEKLGDAGTTHTAHSSRTHAGRVAALGTLRGQDHRIV